MTNLDFLSGFRVLDITNERGYFCAKILADLGAEVIRIEPPESKKHRKDFCWWAYNVGKKVIYLDILKERKRLRHLIEEADFVIQSFSPAEVEALGLDYSELAKVNPRLVVTSITPFGLTGPYKDFKASDLELMAISGFMYVLGDPDRPPVRISFPQAYLIASAEAVVGSLIAHYWRMISGEGQLVDVSVQESLFATLMHGPFFLAWQGINPKREGKYRLGLTGAMFLHPIIWECRDGYVSFVLLGGIHGAHTNRTLVRYMASEGNIPASLRDMKWEIYDLAKIGPEELANVWRYFAEFFKRHSRCELFEIALKEQIQLLPVNTVKDLLDDPHLKDRQFWREVKVPDLEETVRVPGPLARFTLSSAASKSAGPRHLQTYSLPFEGLKVVDFSWAGTGPWITQWLAAYGAEVVKVETFQHPDVTRVAGPYKDNQPGLNRASQFLVYNGGKKSFTLNLNHPDGKQLALRLIQWADVVVESFTPGMMRRWGFDYDNLSKLNPQLVMLSTSLMGANGPHAHLRGFGMQLACLASFAELTGWPDRSPVTIFGAYTDILASRLGGAVLLAALDFQRRTGMGCHIDVSQYEASLHFLTPLILQYQVTGSIPTRAGNRSPKASPHGVFPCRGDDRWCAISIFSDSEWNKLCEIMGKPDLAQDHRFKTFSARKRNEDELEKLVANWTIQFSAEELMHDLQQAGINAAVVKTCADLYHDPQLTHRKHFITVRHPEVGEYDYFSPGFRLQKTPLKAEHAPCIGEHNEYICTQILGLSDQEFIIYLSSGALE